MNESQASIENRIRFDITHDVFMHYWRVIISLDGDVLSDLKYDAFHCIANITDVAYDTMRLILKEWPTCQDQTSTLEPKYRTTVTSSNGLVTVRKSLY